FALILIMLPLESFACGSVAQSFWGMILESDKGRLETFLQSHACSGELKFSPDRADPYVAVVLMNAAHAGVSKDVFESVLLRFNCVAQLKNRSGYQVLIDYVGQERFSEICSSEKLDRVYIVKAQGGANLRASPSLDGEKVGTVAQGSVAINGELHGEWIKVETYAGEGYMHESTLRNYLYTDDR
ncbi:MAG: SH3 domain-containing protein, partial [Woeseiaceae bacterium]